MTLPDDLRAHLSAPSLNGLWDVLRARLERTGHAIAGTVTINLDDDAADRLGGVLGRPMTAGRRQVKLPELDAALRDSSAGRGLVSVIAELTGAPLRDRPAERVTREAEWREVWAQLDADLDAAGLAQRPWVASWVSWLHGGVITRLGVDGARARLRSAVAVLSALDPGANSEPPTQTLGRLAGTRTGTSHGLDDGRTVPALVLRAAAFALGVPAPSSSAERRDLWRALGVDPDEVSGTVLVWALRPSGPDAWSAMMRDRADLGLVTHLTLRELRGYDVPLADEPVHACENPQVLQALADAGVRRPLACFSGNPAAAATLFLQRAEVKYHGDFDWAGVAIAQRVMAAGATPWRFEADDYAAARSRVPDGTPLALAGAAQPTPWDPALADAMAAAGVAVHEETIVDLLAADLE